MATQIILTVCSVFVPVLVLLFGILLRKHPPEPNGLFGYRTKRSMRNAQTWRFAQAYLAKLWIPTGAVMLAVSAAVTAVFWDKDPNAFGKSVEWISYAQIAIMVLTIPLTEQALKKEFDQNDQNGE